MRANLILLVPVVCFVVGASADPAAAQTAPYYPNPYSQPAAPSYPQPAGSPTAPAPQPAPQDDIDWGPARYHPHDYPGPALRGGNGGG
ncbi:MAG TPA: hypothetical protein VGG57_14190 [Stellaceae bacterium]|jgi:hypothetical protein